MKSLSHSRAARRPPRWLLPAAGAAAFLAACAVVVQRQVRQAEAANPPRGRLLQVNGVRLHAMERGDADAPPLVLLHGKTSSAEELRLSGLVGRAAVRYRVLVFDRPGHGHSEAAAGLAGDAQAQAGLIHAALDQLGVRRPVVLGHAWGALVALAMALQRPADVKALVLASPCLNPGLPGWSLQALPGIGPLLRHTLSPLLGRLLWPASAWRLFSPREVTEPFRSEYPVWMALRPSQLQAAAAESARLLPEALPLRRRLAELKTPVVLVAGAEDRMVSTRRQAERLHEALPGSRLVCVEQAGHMVHHVATHRVMQAIDEAAALAEGGSATRRRAQRTAAEPVAPAAAGPARA